jgi:hypothetical protein
MHSRLNRILLLLAAAIVLIDAGWLLLGRFEIDWPRYWFLPVLGLPLIPVWVAPHGRRFAAPGPCSKAHPSVCRRYRFQDDLAPSWRQPRAERFWARVCP